MGVCGAWLAQVHCRMETPIKDKKVKNLQDYRFLNKAEPHDVVAPAAGNPEVAIRRAQVPRVVVPATATNNAAMPERVSQRVGTT